MNFQNLPISNLIMFTCFSSQFVFSIGQNLGPDWLEFPVGLLLNWDFISPTSLPFWDVFKDRTASYELSANQI